MSKKRLTKKQCKQFARIQCGILMKSTSGSEFEDADLTESEVDTLYRCMTNQVAKILKPDEYTLSSTENIIQYVRAHF